MPPSPKRAAWYQSEPDLTWKERFTTLSHLKPLFRLVWEVSPSLTTANAALRLSRAGLPVAMLYVGKLIIDEVSCSCLVVAMPSSSTCRRPDIGEDVPGCDREAYFMKKALREITLLPCG